MKTSKFSILLLTALIVTSCSTSITTPNTDIKSVSQSVNKTSEMKSNVSLVKLTKSDIAKLDHEYSAFSTKSLSAVYFQKKLIQLRALDNGVANAVKIVRELQYAQYKTETVIPFKSMSAADPVFYTILTGIAAVRVQRIGDAPFDSFIGNSSPYPAAPSGLNASAITTTSFTANWTTVPSATSGYVLTVMQGASVFNIYTIPSQATSSQVITGLTTGTTYSYTVQAKNGVLSSPSSNSISAIADYTTSTFAGNVQGSANGTGTAASFYSPLGITTDSSGNIYVADFDNNLIRKITSAGIVTTIAGSGQGSADGNGTAATFNHPTGLTVDSLGNIYVADQKNNMIRKIDTANNVTTFAGNGGRALVNGPATSANFIDPTSMAIDSSGNVYVADQNSAVIRKIATDTNHTVTTFAGTGVAGFNNGDATSAQFSNPAGIVIDSAGNFYVAESNNHKIRKIANDVNHTVSTFAGGSAGFADGTGTGAKFNFPYGLSIDSSNNLYVSEVGGNRIRKITPSAVVTTLGGNGSPGYVNGDTSISMFNNPYGVAVSSDGSKVYVADTSNNKIRKIQ